MRKKVLSELWYAYWLKARPSNFCDHFLRVHDRRVRGEIKYLICKSDKWTNTDPPALCSTFWHNRKYPANPEAKDCSGHIFLLDEKPGWKGITSCDPIPRISRQLFKETVRSSADEKRGQPKKQPAWKERTREPERERETLWQKHKSFFLPLKGVNPGLNFSRLGYCCGGGVSEEASFPGGFSPNLATSGDRESLNPCRLYSAGFLTPRR